ncbi:hypothetical protein KVV02_002159 [Mortierella alpina]|uniref:SUN domain-containing protein n=1 Tax=Mortierella alpina TaxID=64518 RepID=A0A9P8A2S1_MORAP|nr:hypothetical protein KVV02_002159 [Mortierella alpina]
MTRTRGNIAIDNSPLYTTVDNLILPGVIGATVEGPKTPIRSPKARRVYNYFAANQHTPADGDYNDSNGNMTLPHVSDGGSFPFHRMSETSHRRDTMATSRYVDAEVPLENRVSAGGRRGHSSDDPDDMEDDPQHGYSTPREGKRYRKNFRPHDTPIALSKRAFSLHTRNHSNGQRSDGHASPSLRHSSPHQRHLTLGVQEMASSESSGDEDDDEDGDDGQEEGARDTFTSRTPTRGASQETAQRVPVSLELDMDQETFSQEMEDDRGTRYESTQPLHYRAASLQDHSGEEGLDIGDYEDELYPHERLRGHSHEADGAEDNMEASDEEGMAAQLAHEAEEQRKEREQLGFIKRWASLLRKQRDEFGWGTPKRQPGYQSPSSESDSGRSFTSARVRKGFPRRRNPSAPPLNQTSTSPRTPSPIKRTTSNTPKKDIFSVPSMRQMDSGIGGSQDSYDEQYEDTHEMEDEDDQIDQEPFQPLLRLSSSARRRRLNQDAEDAVYESQLETDEHQDLSEDGDTFEDNSRHPSSFGRRASNTSQVEHRRRAVREPLNGRRHTQPSPKHRRVYPWHVIWRMIQGYGRSLEDFLHNAAITIQLWLWIALSWIRFTVEWPWSQRHRLRSTVTSWVDTGVDSGLLSPGTLFGVVVLILVLWGGHSLGFGELSSDSAALQKRQGCDNDTLVVQNPTTDGGVLKGMVSSARDKFSWSSSQVDPQEQLRPRFSWRKWIPHVPSVDVWVPASWKSTSSSSSSSSSSSNRIQIPTDHIQSFEELQSRIEMIQKALDDLNKADDQLGKDSKEKFDHLSDWVSGVERQLNRVSEEVKSLRAYVKEGDWIKQTIKLIHDEIPSQLVVPRDPRTGKLSIPSEFWDKARELFMTSEQVQKLVHDQVALQDQESQDQPDPSSSSGRLSWKSRSGVKKAGKTARWEDYLQENESAMAAFVEDRMSMVSKGVFLNLVKEEAHQIWQGLEKKVVALLERQGKLQGKHAPSRAGGQHKSSPDDNTLRPLTEVERELIAELIDEALDKYSADAMAKPDYALFTAGGRIIPGLTSPNYRAVGTFNILGRIGARMFQPLARKKALEPDMHAGECWPMEGSSGQLAIRLAREIVVTEVTIEHADPSVVLDLTSAPREIEVWSLREGDTASKQQPEAPEGSSASSGGEDKEEQKREGTQDEHSSTTATRKTTRWNVGIPWPGSTLLTSFEYEASTTTPKKGNEGSTEMTRKPKSRQTFAIPLSKQTTSSVGVALRIKSNWGHPKYTCVYRVRVHGYEPEAAQKSS